MIFPILQSQKGEVTHLRCQLVTCGTKVTQAKVTPPQLQGSAVPFTTVPGGGEGGSSRPFTDEAPEWYARG